jgi:hypothetical protein
MPINCRTRASEVRRLAATNWPLAVELAYGLGLIGPADLEAAFQVGGDVLELAGLTAARVA